MNAKNEDQEPMHKWLEAGDSFFSIYTQVGVHLLLLPWASSDLALEGLQTKGMCYITASTVQVLGKHSHVLSSSN